ncbi:MAG: hypothetical protein ABIL58_27755 [Pseudomonadota bacterium]
MIKPISPCPVPGCGDKIEKSGNEFCNSVYYVCQGCDYRVSSLAVHEQICRAMEFARDVAETILDDLVGDEFSDTLVGIVYKAKQIIAGGTDEAD